MKILKLYSLLLLPFLISCYDDKGNYDYKEIPEIIIDGIPDNVSFVGSADHIKFTPQITSSTEGKIEEGNPNYEFKYRIEGKAASIVLGKRWPVLNPKGNLNIDTLATFPSGTYLLWFTVTDRRTGVVTSKQAEVKITSPVYEGYMVLCNEGADKRVRMDMISVLSADRIVTAYNVLEPLGLPNLKNAVSIGWYPQRGSDGDDYIYVMSETGSYKLDQNTFETNEANNMLNTDFMSPMVGGTPLRLAVVGANGWWAKGLLCVNTSGNLFSMNPDAVVAAFAEPVNTPVANQTPTYRVAPYIGCGYARPGNTESAILYDIDNKRFIGWSKKDINICTPLVNPVSPKFDFQTGMDLVYMEGTRFSNGLVYSILRNSKDEYYVYGINVAGDAMTQEAMYKITAPDFSMAKHFAFHSQYAFMYYSVGNKVYSYNLGTGETNTVVSNLPETAEVTMLKFNLFMNPDPNWNSNAELDAKQYDLIVGAYDHATEKGVNGGFLNFYKVKNNENALSLLESYSGFANIVDVVYRERR